MRRHLWAVSAEIYKPATTNAILNIGGPLKPDFGLSGAVLLLDTVFLPLFRVFVLSIPARSPSSLTACCIVA